MHPFEGLINAHRSLLSIVQKLKSSTNLSHYLFAECVEMFVCVNVINVLCNLAFRRLRLQLSQLRANRVQVQK